MNFIDDFMTLTEGLPTPQLFRLWSAIGTLSCAMERRLYIRSARKILHPNLYIMLIGPPASGKSVALEPAKNLLRSINKFKISPSSLTKSSLIDSLYNAHSTLTTLNGPIEQSSLSIIVDELGVFMSEHDLSFISVLNDIWGNPQNYSEQRRTVNAGKVKDLINPQINLLVGTQPAFLASILPEEAWGMGLMSRVIMIYSNTAPTLEDLFAEEDNKFSYLENSLKKYLKEISQLHGNFEITDEAKGILNKYHKAGYPPKPDHFKLQHYCPRRGMQLLKLCMVASIADDLSKIINRDHVLRAMDWLIQAEALMPDVFNDMTLKNDSEIIRDVHYWLYKEYKNTNKAVHISRINEYLSHKVPVEKIPRIIEIAEKSNVIERIEGTTLYTPRARD